MGDDQLAEEILQWAGLQPAAMEWENMNNGGFNHRFLWSRWFSDSSSSRADRVPPAWFAHSERIAAAVQLRNNGIVISVVSVKRTSPTTVNCVLSCLSGKSRTFVIEHDAGLPLTTAALRSDDVHLWVAD